MRVLGIDIGGSSVKVAVLEDGEVVRTGGSGRYSRPSPQEVAQAIREAAGDGANGVYSVGLCVPGLLDEAKERLTFSVNIPGLEGTRLSELVAASVGGDVRRVVVATDSNATAYDLYHTRGLGGRMLVFVIGTGIGAAVIDANGPLYVDGESPGHFGQMDVSLEGEPVIGLDGGAGSLEGYLGAGALKRRYGPDVYQAVDHMKPLDPPIRALARAIRIGHAIYRPHHVVLAGGLGIRLGHLLPALYTMVETNLTDLARPDWTLTVGESDFHAAAGAARMAVQT
jgi:predicted NBD/HSP70 family sugar kinase